MSKNLLPPKAKDPYARWLPYEDQILLTWRRAHPSPAEWELASFYLPNKSIGGCRSRWRKLTRTKKEEESESTPSNHLLIPLTQTANGFQDLPDIPLKEICRYLSVKEVFWVLPLVCRNYHQIIRGSSMPVREIRLIFGERTAVQLIMLAHRVASCQKMVLEGVPGGTTSFSVYCLKELLNQVINSVKNLQVKTHWQPAIVQFVNQSKVLQHLAIHTINRTDHWNWSEHQVNKSIRRLYYNENQLSEWRAESVVQKFPSLNSVELWNGVNYSFPPSDHHPRLGFPHILRIQGSVMIETRRLAWLERLSIEITGVCQLRKLNVALPNLERLQLFRVRFTQNLLGDMLDPDLSTDQDMHFIHLVNAVRQNSSVRNVWISSRYRERNTRNDEKGEWLLATLPLRISEIAFRGKTLRPHSKESKGWEDIPYLFP